jgi:hypothetical protein
VNRRRTLHLSLTTLLLAAAPLLCGGCASHLGSRGRDAADILTLSIGTGVGGRLRAGPLHAGLVADSGTTGLRGGRLHSGLQGDSGTLEYLGFPIDKVADLQPRPCFASEAFEPLDPRGKGYTAFSRVPFLTTTLYTEEGVSGPRFHPYLTQVEAQIGLLLMFRIGLNPGEALDFLLGWFGLDLFADDAAERAATPPAESGRK